ncbi:MAG: class I SAM-dependent methyltransferase [Proteobacteria bacterium]|nr:class I SAM-dependent methyltransferase [Pseudomonadota bacterium]
MKQCRFCKQSLAVEFVDLVSAPPSNSFLKQESLAKPEVFYPLKLYVCESCMLVQIDEYKSANEIFDSDYVYFSSFSTSWLDHCKRYAYDMARRFKLDHKSKVVEVASNDGYLLQYFKEQKIPTLGIEPTQSTATVAVQKGIETVVRFFGQKCAMELAAERGKVDLIAANNVLAHVPDVNDFVLGFKHLLADHGVVTVEFPHLLQLVKLKQFDTIYHEHFSYFSLLTICKIFEKHGLRVFDVEELTTHGGSLRIFVDHGKQHDLSPAVGKLLATERQMGLDTINFYRGFQAVTDQVKNECLRFLVEAKLAGKTIAAYGAAAKGNTFLNYCGVKPDLLPYVVDASPHKQGRYMPGSHIPVVAESKIREMKPDYVMILPWNLKQEITEQLSYIREWKGKFVIAIPHLEIF